MNPAAPGGVYAYCGEHPDEGAWFARAMGRTTAILVSELARTGFRPLTAGRIVDVGGSRGTLLAHLLQVLPDADGVLLDRAEALAEAPGYLAAAGVAGRVEMAVGGRERTVAEHEALLGAAGYRLVRDTPLTDVLPWRVLEFQRS